MCGIVGFAGYRGITPEMLASMRDTMVHRGPDDCGLWYSDDRMVGLSQRRLSIIDLSPGGRQPMSDASGRVHITFNGEIYNFRELRKKLDDLGHTFRTASDTEVILEAYRQWGEDFPRHLVGMFAMALYDLDRRCLYLGRDRAGEKPLFVWQGVHGLLFASELKALFALPEFPRRLNRAALEHYLAFGYVPRDLCLVDGVRKLLPGSMLRFDLNDWSQRMWRYWDLPRFDGNGKQHSIGDLADELDVLLLQSVRRQMIADVPVGILLSGGVDSSLVTAMAARSSARPVKTFTISFPGSGSYDEAPHARMVAKHFGTEHTELSAEAASVTLLPELARQFDEPIGDSSMIPTFLVSRLVRQHAKVALGGDGGDELFGGYAQYIWIMRLARMQKLMPLALRRIIARSAMALPAGTRGRNYAIAVGGRPFEPVVRMGLFFDEEWRQRLLANRSIGGSIVHPTPDELRLELTDGACTILQAAQRLDFRTYMADDILVKVDRASMLNSLEIRAPFLDPEVIEFAYGKVPDRLKTTLNGRKVLLRHLAARLLPPQLDLKRKQGFSIPMNAWFAGSWGEVMRDVLASAPAELFNRAAVDELVKQQTRRGNQGSRLFALTIFELWRREYGIAL